MIPRTNKAHEANSLPDSWIGGGIIDEDTLMQMLNAGQLAGAGLDVTAIEPLPQDSSL